MSKCVCEEGGVRSRLVSCLLEEKSAQTRHSMSRSKTCGSSREREALGINRLDRLTGDRLRIGYNIYFKPFASRSGDLCPRFDSASTRSMVPHNATGPLVNRSGVWPHKCYGEALSKDQYLTTPTTGSGWATQARTEAMLDLDLELSIIKYMKDDALDSPLLPVRHAQATRI